MVWVRWVSRGGCEGWGGWGEAGGVGSSFWGSLRGEAPHKLQVGVVWGGEGEALPPQRAEGAGRGPELPGGGGHSEHVSDANSEHASEVPEIIVLGTWFQVFKPGTIYLPRMRRAGLACRLAWNFRAGRAIMAGLVPHEQMGNGCTLHG